MRRHLPHIGLALGLLVWALCAGSLLYAEGRRVMQLPAVAWGKRLVGVAAVSETVAPTWPNLVDARWQGAVGRGIGRDLPGFAWAVRLRNQLDWTLLHHTSSAVLMRGRGGTLVETTYAVEYCSRNVAAWRPGALVWASRIREMQDITERHGRAFLYVLTPSKVSQYPDILPRAYNCPATASDRRDLPRVWLAMLRDAGVHVADTTAPVMQAHADYPFRLWSVGGAHWDTVAQAIGTQALVAAMGTLLPQWDVTPFAFSWSMSKHPIPPDNDLADLANLMFEPDYASPNAVEATAPVTGSCNPPHVVIVGGSFSQQLEIWLSRMPCSVPVVLYDYWQVFRFTADPREMFSGGPVDPAERDPRVRQADLLVYEENEQVLGTQQHGTALWEMLRASADQTSH